jgi:hypothetical protein
MKLYCILLVCIMGCSVRGGSRNVGAASRRMLASRSSKHHGTRRDKPTHSRCGKVVIRDIDFRVYWFWFLTGLYIMYRYW